MSLIIKQHGIIPSLEGFKIIIYNYGKNKENSFQPSQHYTSIEAF